MEGYIIVAGGKDTSSHAGEIFAAGMGSTDHTIVYGKFSRLVLSILNLWPCFWYFSADGPRFIVTHIVSATITQINTDDHGYNLQYFQIPCGGTTTNNK